MTSYLRRAAGALAGAVAAAVLALPALAAPADFYGNWHNVDPNAQSLVRIDVHPSAFGIEVHAFGACSPQACDWGNQPGQFTGPDTLRAKYVTSFSIVWLTLHRQWGDRLDFKTHTHFTDNSGRPDYDSAGLMMRWGGGGPGWGPGGPGSPGGPGGGTPVLGAEDCIGFDPAQVSAAFVGGDWKVVQGSMWMLDYGSNAVAAHRAAFVIHHYQFTQQCFVRRPNAQMMYWKSGGVVPVGGLPGQDCIGLHPMFVQAQFVAGDWKVVDGANWLLDYGPNHAAADQAVAVIQTYHLNRQCFIVRPNASMMYWLAQ